MRRVLGALIALILAGNAAALFTIDDEKHPSGWDPRIEPLASFVEDARDLRFDHAVEVEFLPNDEYRKRQTTQDAELTAEERRDLRLFEGQARALGLIGSDTRVLDDLNAIGADATAAYYDDTEKKMVIRGTEFTVATRVTIVHELTHALQDQAFGLDREFDSDGETSFFRALVEGDATRIETEYAESLDEADRTAYLQQEEQTRNAARSAVGNVAPSLLLFFGAPYALGEQVTRIVVAEGGDGRLNRLFRDPPDSDEGLLNVFALLNDEKRERAPRLTVREGERRTDGGEFGVVPWYLVLTSFVDPKTALAAVDGWAGDRYLGYRKDDRTCIRISFVGDTANDTAEMVTALNQWKAAFTGNTVQVLTSGDTVELDTCEPDATPKPRPDAQDALNLPAARLALIHELLVNDVPAKGAECITRNVLAQIPLDKLTAPGPAEQRVVQQVAQSCASGRIT